jgi:membrane protein DedA with SNARE-associated domain
MTVVVASLCAVLGLFVGSAMAFAFARYMRWVRRRHPTPVSVRALRKLFVFPLFLIFVVTIAAAGPSADSGADIHNRELIFFGYMAGFLGTPLVYWLRRRRSSP